MNGLLILQQYLNEGVVSSVELDLDLEQRRGLK